LAEFQSSRAEAFGAIGHETTKLMDSIASIRLLELAGETTNLFQTAVQIPPEQHLRVQAAFQKHVDNAVSKTANLPTEASPRDVAAARIGLPAKGLPYFAMVQSRNLGWAKYRKNASTSPNTTQRPAGSDGIKVGGCRDKTASSSGADSQWTGLG